MSLKLIFDFIAISGIFTKDTDLNILPPPPPFPKIGEEAIESKSVGKKEEERKKRAEGKRKEKIGRKKYKEYLGKKEEERKKLAQERERQQKKQKQVEEKKQKEPERIDIKGQFKVLENEAFSAPPAVELEIPKQKISKKPFFEKIFGKKKEKTELERELQDLEEIELKPMKREGTKSRIISKVPDLKEIEKEVIRPEQIRETEEEIQNAISRIKVKKPFIAKGLFRKKKPVEEKIATPEVMPRTYDKIDYVEEIEEKLHKARLALMDFKFDEAKRAYIEIMQAYNTLNPKDKHKVYQDIKDLYYERKSAAKFAK